MENDDAPTDTSTSISSVDGCSTFGIPEERLVEPHVGYKKVLVTGGAGFIGSSVALHLLTREMMLSL